MKLMSDKYKNMAIAANWTGDIQVSYRFASRDDTVMASQPASVGLVLLLVLIIVMMTLGCGSMVIELTHVGDLPNLDYKRLVPASKFVSIKQYEPIALSRKRTWAQFILMFSALRNFMGISKQPRGYQVCQNPGMNVHPSTIPHFKWMKIFNGLTGFFLIYSVWGTTYFFS